MGYIRHHAIVVTGTGYGDKVSLARDKAIEIFNMHFAHYPMIDEDDVVNNISEIVRSGVNGYETFIIAPDGSKEGWEHSNIAERARDEFIEWMKSGDRYLNWAYIQYGDDDGQSELLDDSDACFRK